MRLTIAQFTSSLRFGGQERVIVDLAKSFHSKGHKSLVCTTAVAGDLVHELKSSNIPFQCLGLKKSYDPLGVISVMRYLKKNRVDVVITHGNYRLIPRIATILSKVPIFFHVEHTISSDYKKSYFIFINKILSFFTDKIICVSESTRQSLLRNEGADIHKLVVIPNGINTERFSSVVNLHKNHNSTKRVGMVGRFTEEKGHIYFVEAAAKVIQSFNKVEFIFVGDGPLRPLIEQKVRECGLGTYCYFLGVRPDIGDLLQTFDIFVLSSLREGLSISLLESQYFGVASIVTEVGGNPEVIKDGYNGLLVPPKDPDALASAILRVLNNDELKNEVGLHAKEVFNQKFSVEKMANAYLNQIYSILEQKKRLTK